MPSTSLLDVQRLPALALKAEFVVPPQVFVPHERGIAFTFIGQDVLEIRPGELWMFCHYGRKPTEFSPADMNYRQPPILKSYDGGRTWDGGTPMNLPWSSDGYLSDGGVSLLRLPGGRLVFVSHRYGTPYACRGSHGVPVISVSDDDGATWSPARLLHEHDGIYYVMNQRLVRLQSGRLVLPVSARDPRTALDDYGEGLSPTISTCFLSDDEGESWRLGREHVRQDTARGAQEPCVAEVSLGNLLMLFRSGRGYHQACWSKDGGETWTEPQDTMLRAACSPLTLTTLPDGRLIVVYNHCEPQFLESYYPRNPLVYALSDDGGESWSEPVLIDDQPGQQLIYPSVTPLASGILIVYCAAFAPGDGSFTFPTDAWSVGGGKRCVIKTP